MSNRPTLAPARTIAGVIVALVAMIASPGSASAHTDFVSSAPADGSTVVGPVSTVTVEFTNPAVVSGDGFQLLDPDGVVRAPDALDPTDGTTFIATFDPPLEPGVYGFRWDVQAGDAHPIQGSFRFTVEAPPTTTDAGTVAGAADADPTTVDSTAVPAVPSAGGASDVATLDEFLEAGDDVGSIVGRVGRTMSMAGTIAAAGIIAALVAFVRGRRDELRALIGWVRLAGVVVIAGGVTEFAALDETQTAGVTDLIGTKPGTAALLKVGAGLLVFFGFGDRSGTIGTAPRSLSSAAAVQADVGVPDVVPGGDPDVDASWSPDGTTAVGVVGLLLGIVSFSFDGHTVSRGPWLVHALVNLVHVGTVAVWVGGVISMTALAVLRRRRAERTGLAAMVIRFSKIAAISLGALAVAGIVMIWMVVDGPSDVVSTDWGRVLLVKVVVVGIAAGMGAYNHFALRPALEQQPADPALTRHLRISLSIESAAFVAVIVLTAILVGSAT